MAKARYPGPPEKLELYQALVSTVAGVEVKGATMPYTSRNGHMTSFLDKDGEVSLRLSEAEREEFIEKHDAHISVQHGAEMKDFVVVPASMLETRDEAGGWFAKSWEWAGTLKPKPTKK